MAVGRKRMNWAVLLISRERVWVSMVLLWVKWLLAWGVGAIGESDAVRDLVTACWKNWGPIHLSHLGSNDSMPREATQGDLRLLLPPLHWALSTYTKGGTLRETCTVPNPSSEMLPRKRNLFLISFSGGAGSSQSISKGTDCILNRTCRSSSLRVWTVEVVVKSNWNEIHAFNEDTD